MHILHISVCHLDARMKRWISDYIYILMDMFQKMLNFPNLEIEMLEYVWEQFPHVQKSRSQKTWKYLTACIYLTTALP